MGREPAELVVLRVTTQTFQMPLKNWTTGNRASRATMGTYIRKTKITSEA